MRTLLRNPLPLAALALLWLSEPLAARPGLKTLWTIGVALVAGWLIWVTKAQARRTVLAVRGLEIVDEAGRKRLMAYTDSSGLPILQMYDAEGKSQLTLADTAEGAGLMIYKGENPRVMLVASSVGIGGLSFYDSEGRARLGITVGPGDTPPELVLYDAKEQARAKFGLQPDGSPVLQFYDAAGKELPPASADVRLAPPTG